MDFIKTVKRLSDAPRVIGGLINQSSFAGAVGVTSAAQDAAYLEPVRGSKFLVSSPDVAFVTKAVVGLKI